MGIFGNYQKEANLELERSIQNLERQKASIDMNELAKYNANLQFAQRLNLINLRQARAYHKRLSDLLYTMRTQTGIIDDGYENPLEREIRYSNMDQLKADIEKTRASFYEFDSPQPQNFEKAAERTANIQSR